ncbi:hypothetical protein RQP46_002766 [Phenoliferia psychrophenolica]
MSFHNNFHNTSNVRIICRGVPYGCKEEDVLSHFSTFGKIESWEQPANRDFLFVTYSDPRSAQNARFSSAPFLGNSVAIFFSWNKPSSWGRPGYDAPLSYNNPAEGPLSLADEQEPQSKSLALASPLAPPPTPK